MKFQAYTDPMGTLDKTLGSLYDFIPAIRRQRSRGLLESPVTTQNTGQDLSYLLPPESGGQGDWGGSGNSGWGDVGLPVSNTDMGIPATIGPAQALGNVVGLLGLPGLAAVSLPASLAMQQKGIDPVNSLLGFNPVTQLANAFGIGVDPAGLGYALSAAEQAFGYDGTGLSAPDSYGPGAIGGPVGGFGADYGDPMGGFGGLGIGNPGSYGGASAGPAGAASGDPSGGLAGNDGLGDVW